MKGSISMLVIAGIVTTALAGSYFYLDHQADSRATETMLSLVDEAKSQGVAMSYSSVDASPISQTVKITDFEILGNEQEPDIRLGSVVLEGFSWQDLNNNQNKLPNEMSINIKNGELYLKKSMVDPNPNIQALVRIFGDTIPFTTKITYKLDPTKKLLNLSLTQAVEDNFFINSEITLGNMAWLTEIEQQQTQMPDQVMLEAMNSTLNDLSIIYKNTGLIEKIRAEISNQTGKTNEQLLAESLAQMKQLQITSAQQWGPIFTPFIDEMIKFSSEPKQLKLAINPQSPLTGQDFMMGFMGDEASLIKLIEDAQIKLKAN
tara:strand:+ start:131458 stop:132411 length:954 start_codon:yes stop_codon:yes gene_type:complete